MGSNVVRLTDRKYMLKLMFKIRQDHETKQQNRIEERKVIYFFNYYIQALFPPLRAAKMLVYGLRLVSQLFRIPDYV